MNKVLCAISILILATGLKAQVFKGNVYNADTKETVAFADVFIPEYSVGSVTDDKGSFQINIPFAGVFEVKVSFLGYANIIDTIELGTKDTLIKNYYLQESQKNLNAVEVNAGYGDFGIARLRSVEGAAIYASKKNEIIPLDEINANLATNNSRQIYARIAGVNIWESDYAGLQLGIGARGLSPNRTSNFNVRQNGFDISADPLGYPESYYTPPAEALERIEVVRGAASLQYGTQFGGLLNFIVKKGNKDKSLEVTSRQTVGSYGLFNSFNSVGGRKGRFRYYTFYQFKRADGWRPNSSFDNHTAHTNMQWIATEKLQLGFEYTFMDYKSQQAGGLTDFMFEQDPSQSVRERNWFAVNWNLPAIKLNYKFSNQTKLNWRNYGLIGNRKALGFLGNINRIDPGGERDLLVGEFTNFGSELRVIHRYQLFNRPSNFLVGARYFHGNTRKRQGDAPAGSEPNFTYLNPGNLERSDFTFPNDNIAIFSENIFNLSEKFTFTPGIRYEYINTRSDGYFRQINTDLSGDTIFDQKFLEVQERERNLVLLGAGLSFRPSSKAEIYANFSQNYRAINFNDIRVVNPNLRVDSNISDERGYNADLGIRGQVSSWLFYDISAFYLSYANRIGVILRKDEELLSTYRYRTNVASARNMGLESLIEIEFVRLLTGEASRHKLSAFSNLSLINSKYIASEERAIDENEVEFVPPLTWRWGLTYKIKTFTASFQYSYTANQYTDATNAELDPNAVSGIIPAYEVFDFTASYLFGRFKIETGVNNLLNNTYFTRRASGYPGPGIIPAQPRNIFLTLQIKI